MFYNQNTTNHVKRVNDIALSLETYVQIRHFYTTHQTIRNLKIFLSVLLGLGLFLSSVQLGSCFDYDNSLQDYMNYNEQEHGYLMHKSAEITEQILLVCCMLVGLFAVLLESRSGIVVFCLFNLSTIIYTACLPVSDHFWQIETFLLVIGCLAIWLLYLMTKRRSNYVVFS